MASLFRQKWLKISRLDKYFVAQRWMKTDVGIYEVNGKHRPGAETDAQTIVTQVLALPPPAARASALCKWRLRRVHEHISANITAPIALADLAEVAGLSRMYFAAQFRAATGYRPREFVAQQRINLAKTLLSSSSMPLVEVALSAGFQNQSYFSTVFRRLTGETPGRWRQAERYASGS